MNDQISPVKWIDASGTIATGGTAQFLFSSVLVKGFHICNPDASETLWFSDSTTAAANATGSVPVVAGALYETPVNYRPAGPVSVVAATSGHKMTIKYYI